MHLPIRLLFICWFLHLAVSAKCSVLVDDIELSIDTFWVETQNYNGNCIKSIDIQVRIENNSDSIYYFTDPTGITGYQSFSFNCYSNDSTYHFVRCKRLWWGGLPSFIKLFPHKDTIIHFSIVNSNTTDHGKCIWDGLPENFAFSMSISVVYEPPSIEKQLYYQQLLCRRNYRLKNYRDSIHNFDEEDISIENKNPPACLNFYNKCLVSERVED